MKTRIFSFALVLVMLLSLASFASAEDPIVITVTTNAHAGSRPESLDQDFIHNFLLEKLNIDVQLADLDEYDVTLGVRLSAPETTPDMFILPETYVAQYASMGLLLDLTPYKETTLKCVYDALGEGVETQAQYYDGHLYTIPAAKSESQRYDLILVRKDWNDKLNLTPPTTVDELFDYCKTLAESDPDGNGVKDTVGLTGFGVKGLNIITSPFGVSLSNVVLIDDNGVVTNTLLHPRMKEALEAVKKFYDAGLLDPDMMTSNSLAKATYNGCNVAVVGIPWANSLKPEYVKQYKDVNPDAEYTWIGALTDGQGGPALYGVLDHDLYSGSKYAINADLEQQPEKLDAIWKLIEYLASDDGFMLVYFGIEGDHWVWDENGDPVIDQEKTGETNYIHQWQFLGRSDYFYCTHKFAAAKDAIDFGWNEVDRIPVYDNAVVIPDYFTTTYTDLNDYVKSQLIGFWKGERPIEEYDKFVQELYDIYDFGTYMEIAGETLIERGLATSVAERPAK